MAVNPEMSTKTRLAVSCWYRASGRSSSHSREPRGTKGRRSTRGPSATATSTRSPTSDPLPRTRQSRRPGICLYRPILRKRPRTRRRTVTPVTHGRGLPLVGQHGVAQVAGDPVIGADEARARVCHRVRSVGVEDVDHEHERGARRDGLAAPGVAVAVSRRHHEEDLRADGAGPTRPLSQPGITPPVPIGKLAGEPLSHEESNTSPVSQSTPV